MQLANTCVFQADFPKFITTRDVLEKIEGIGRELGAQVHVSGEVQDLNLRVREYHFQEFDGIPLIQSGVF